MVIPPAALIDKEEEEKNLAEKLHANVQGERTGLDCRVGGEREEEEEEGKNPPLRYVSLCDVYSATSPCVSSASGGSKKVKPPNHHHRKSFGHFSGHDHHPSKPFQLSSLSEVMSSNINDNSNSGRSKPPITHCYSRRNKGKRKRKHEEDEEGENENSNADVCHKVKKEGFEEANGDLISMRRTKRKSGGHEGLNFGAENSTLIDRDMVGLKESQNTVGVGNGVRNKNSIVEIGSCNNNSREMRRQKNKADSENNVKQSGSLRKKKWVWCDSCLFISLFYLEILFNS